MKQVNIFIFAVFALIVLMNACKKDDATTSDNVKGKWIKTEAYTVMYDTITEKDSVDYLYKKMKECEKDNILLFGDNNMYALLPGATKCDTSEVDSVKGIWVFANSYKNIRLFGKDTTEYNIILTTANQLKVSQENYPLQNSTLYLTFQKVE